MIVIKTFWQILILIFFLVDFQTISSQTCEYDFNRPADSLTFKKEWFLSSMVRDQGKLWTSPLRIEKKDLAFWSVIVSHPESKVRDIEYDTHQGLFNRGYHFSGPGIQVTAEKRFRIIKGLFISLEAKATAAIAKVGIAEGYAIVPQAGFHGLFGLGYKFEK